MDTHLVYRYDQFERLSLLVHQNQFEGGNQVHFFVADIRN